MSAPPITFVSACGSCQQAMGPFRVYQGKGTPSRRFQRGSVCQTCTNINCRYTLFHTQPYPNVGDADRVANALNEARLQGVTGPLEPLQPVALSLPAPLPPTFPSLSAPALPASAPTRIECSIPTCMKGRSRSTANKDCLERKCAPCCRLAYETARQQGKGRLGCTAHKQPPVLNPASLPFHLPTQAGNSAHVSTVDGSAALGAIEIPPTMTFMAPPPPPAHVSAAGSPAQQLLGTVEVPSLLPPAAMPPSSAALVPSARSLAQPLPPAWSDARKRAQEETRKLVSAKERAQEIAKLNQKMVTLVIYYMVLRQPIVLSHSVDTWPHLQLSAIPSLIKDLGLTLESYLEYYNGVSWILIRISSPITVTRDQRVLLRVRKSLTEEFDDEEWPNLCEEMQQQKRSGQSTGRYKRSAQELVSPLKKAARDEVIASTTDARPRSPSPAPLPTVLPLAVPATRVLPQASSHPIKSTALEVPAVSSRPCKPKPRKVSTAPSHLSMNSVKAIPGAQSPPQWPDDFYVCDIDAGLREITKLTARGTSQNKSFSAVFDGAAYRRTTVAKYKALWDNKSNREQRDRFIGYGRIETATFLRFVQACTGKLPRRKGQTNAAKSKSHRPADDSEADFSDSESESVTATDADELGNDWEAVSDVEEACSKERCPFCAEPLPESPTPHLESLLLELKKLPGYPNRLSIVVFMDYCSRHRFETHEIPKAVAAGWPDHIDFSKLASRIRDIKTELNELVHDPEDSQFFQNAVQGKKGENKSGIATFDKEGCGYYGELGFQIISTTLRQMFPSSAVDLEMVKPLSWNDMIDKFLVPEAAALLIMEDTGTLWEDAVDILHKSRVYGNSVNPFSDDHPAVLAARPPVDIKVEEEPDNDNEQPTGRIEIDLTLDEETDSDLN